MAVSSDIRPRPLSLHASSAARLCSFRTATCYLADPDGYCDSYKRISIPARTVDLSSPFSDQPDNIVSAAAESRRDSYNLSHILRFFADAKERLNMTLTTEEFFITGNHFVPVLSHFPDHDSRSVNVCKVERQ